MTQARGSFPEHFWRRSIKLFELRKDGMKTNEDNMRQSAQLQLCKKFIRKFKNTVKQTDNNVKVDCS